MNIPRNWSCGHSGSITRMPGETRRNNKRWPDAGICPECYRKSKQAAVHNDSNVPKTV